MKQFQGRVICPGTCEAEALVSHGGFNTLASYQMALMFHDKQVKCGDQNNPDLYKKPMIGKALCLPETIGSTTGGMVLYTACASGQQPACMLFSKHIDSLAASGAILASVWTDATCRSSTAWATNFSPPCRRARPCACSTAASSRWRNTFAEMKRG